MEALVFWILAIGLTSAALAVVFHRDPVAAAFCLLGVLLLMAGVFAMLQAFFMATVQILFYTSAVMALFWFALKQVNTRTEKKQSLPWVKLGLVGIVTVLLGGLYFRILGKLPHGDTMLNRGDESTTWTPGRLGELLFNTYLLPLQITVLLLLAAVVGVVQLGRHAVMGNLAKSDFNADKGLESEQKRS
ncbi:MAG: NADH-quinone oxidoreductase subunit J [Verrucomicrobiota bacterium]